MSSITLKFENSDVTSHLFSLLFSINFIRKDRKNIHSLSKACKLLSKGGSCDGTERVDDCQCTVMRKGVYRLKYVKTADMLSSNGTVYIKWPGTRKEKTLGKHYLPVVKSKPLS